MATKLTSADQEMLLKAADMGLLSATFRNRTVCITGRLSMRREDVVKLIEATGGIFCPRVSWGCHTLIVGDTGRHGITRKIMDAQMRGVEVIGEDEFVRRLQP